MQKHLDILSPIKLNHSILLNPDNVIKMHLLTLTFGLLLGIGGVCGAAINSRSDINLYRREQQSTTLYKVNFRLHSLQILANLISLCVVQNAEKQRNTYVLRLL